MLNDAGLALEEIKPKDRTCAEVLGARVALYITAQKWDMAAARRQSSRKRLNQKTKLGGSISPIP